MSIVQHISSYAFVAIIMLILIAGAFKEVKVWDVFAEGAGEGIKTVLRIMPSLIGLMVSISVFRASGALDLLIFAVKPVTSLLGIPPEAVPLAILRPVSGSASLALISDIMKTYGPDSFVGRVVSTMMGSTETIFYTLAVYYGSVGIKNIRYTLVAALIADAASVIASVAACRLLFGA